jgi:hypothetical protein
VGIRVKSDLAPALTYFRQLEARYAALGAHITHGSAQYVRDAVAEGQPGDRDGEQMRRALSVAKIVGADLTDPKLLPKAFAVMLDTERVPKAKLRELGPQDVVYVRPKRRRAVRVAPEIEALVRFSPWTPDLLPFFPSKRQAVLVYRKVSREEVDSVREARVKDAPQWRAVLASAGVDTSKPRPAPIKVEVTPDLVFYAARQEFGGGKRRALKLWRKAVRRLVGSGVSTMMRQPGVAKLLSDPNDKSWRTLAKISGNTRITEQQAASFNRFAQRLTS